LGTSLSDVRGWHFWDLPAPTAKVRCWRWSWHVRVTI